jgi:hypothetical protein
MNEFISFGRLVQAARRAANSHGLNGDPFCELPPIMLDTAGMELAAAEIYLDIPKAVRDIAPSLAQQMCRAIVYSHGRRTA